MIIKIKRRRDYAIIKNGINGNERKCINELQNNDIDKDRRKALEDELSSITLELEQREFSARIKK